jgi:hypothetical protein
MITARTEDAVADRAGDLLPSWTRRSVGHLNLIGHSLRGLAEDLADNDARMGVDGLEVQPLPGHQRLNLRYDCERQGLQVIQQLEKAAADDDVHSREAMCLRLEAWTDPDRPPTASPGGHRRPMLLPIMGVAAIETGLLYEPVKEVFRAAADAFSLESAAVAGGFAVLSAFLAHEYAYACADVSRATHGRARALPEADRRRALLGLASLATMAISTRAYAASLGTGAIAWSAVLVFVMFQLAITLTLLLVPKRLVRKHRESVQDQAKAELSSARKGLESAASQRDRLEGEHAAQIDHLGAQLAEAREVYQRTFIDRHPDQRIADVMRYRGAQGPADRTLFAVPPLPRDLPDSFFEDANSNQQVRAHPWHGNRPEMDRVAAEEATTGVGAGGTDVAQPPDHDYFQNPAEMFRDLDEEAS